jgi:hypothetical protein
LILIAVGIGGFFYGKSFNKPIAPVQRSVVANEGSDRQEIKTYRNERLNFSLNYRSHLDSVTEEPNRILFHEKTDDMTGFGVVVEKVPYQSTSEWIAAQTKGSASGPGYEGILWINGYRDNGNGLLLVNEYMQVDGDETGPIYGKSIYGVFVKNGFLYKILSKNEYPANAVPSLDSELMDVFSSFQPLN